MNRNKHFNIYDTNPFVPPIALQQMPGPNLLMNMNDPMMYNNFNFPFQQSIYGVQPNSFPQNGFMDGLPPNPYNNLGPMCLPFNGVPMGMPMNFPINQPGNFSNQPYPNNLGFSPGNINDKTMNEKQNKKVSFEESKTTKDSSIILEKSTSAVGRESISSQNSSNNGKGGQIIKSNKASKKKAKKEENQVVSSNINICFTPDNSSCISDNSTPSSVHEKSKSQFSIAFEKKSSKKIENSPNISQNTNHTPKMLDIEGKPKSKSYICSSASKKEIDKKPKKEKKKPLINYQELNLRSRKNNFLNCFVKNQIINNSIVLNNASTLTVKIKVRKDDVKELKINPNDDIYSIVNSFIKEEKLDEILIEPIYYKIVDAFQKINGIMNAPLPKALGKKLEKILAIRESILDKEKESNFQLKERSSIDKFKYSKYEETYLKNIRPDPIEFANIGILNESY